MLFSHIESMFRWEIFLNVVGTFELTQLKIAKSIQSAFWRTFASTAGFKSIGFWEQLLGEEKNKK